jgi:pimeloyl-ACP methyl ester carboxylesterase
MKRVFFAAALVASALTFALPARASMPAPLPAPVASYNAGSLHVDVYGTAGKPSMIFIPGLLCGPWEWSAEIAQFAPDYTIYALTLPGFDGQPSIATDPFVTVTTDFWSWLDARRIDRPIVIGHSLGGTLGFALAEQHPERLRAVVAVDGLPVYPSGAQMTPAQRNDAGSRMASMFAGIPSAAVLESSEKIYALPYLISSKSDIDAVAPLMARSNPKAAGAWLQADLSSDFRPNLPKATAPILEIAPFDPQVDSQAGLQTARAKQAFYASLLAGAPAAKVEIIRSSRHFVMYDQPQALHDALKRFVGSLGTGQGHRGS